MLFHKWVHKDSTKKAIKCVGKRFFQIFFTTFAPCYYTLFKVETFEMIAKTFQGLEEVLAKELIENYFG